MTIMISFNASYSQGYIITALDATYPKYKLYRRPTVSHHLPSAICRHSSSSIELASAPKNGTSYRSKVAAV
jgi:hypothetical protein